MNTPQSTQTGTITMADGSSRQAWLNTYAVTKFSEDGRTATTATESRIEFLLDTNGAAGSGRKYRKVSPKQAATFTQD